MSQIFFPEIEYENHLAEKFKITAPIQLMEFNFNAMVLIALNRYCLQHIIYEVCDIKFNYKQVYTYSFNPNEIQSLGRKSADEIIRHKEICTTYDYVLSTYKIKHKGQIKIDINFSDNGTFETSFYTIEIELIPETGMKILPYFLTENGFIMHLSEFMHNLWTPVFAELEGINIPTRVKSSNYKLETLYTTLQTGNIELFQIPAEKKDFISDVFNIVHSLFVGLNPIKSGLFVSADDILSIRGLAKNANSKGVRGGYKTLDRTKVHLALQGLNYLDMLYVTTLSDFNYVISIPAHIKAMPKFSFPKKLVEYNYKTQLWQRRLGYCLCANKTSKIKISKLYAEVEELCGSFRPVQIRDKMEEVLDYLASDGIIANWHYEKIDENAMIGKNWIERWKKLYVIYRY